MNDADRFEVTLNTNRGAFDERTFRGIREAYATLAEAEARAKELASQPRARHQVVVIWSFVCGIRYQHSIYL